MTGQVKTIANFIVGSFQFSMPEINFFGNGINAFGP